MKIPSPNNHEHQQPNPRVGDLPIVLYVVVKQAHRVSGQFWPVLAAVVEVVGVRVARVVS